MIKLVPLFSLLLISVSCAKDDTVSIPDSTSLVATSVTAIDVGDNDNPKDVSVSFNAALEDEFISEYRVFYAKAETLIGLDGAKALLESSYKSFSNGEDSYLSFLNENQLSFDGSPMKVGEQYKVYVLSTTENDDVFALSDASPNFTIFNTSIFDSTNYQAEITIVEDNANTGNASDIVVSFDKAIANIFIEEYRILVAKSSTEISLAIASNLTDVSYTQILKEQVNFNISLLENQLDYDGNEIEDGIEYEIYILSIGTFNEDKVQVLSEPSVPFEFKINPEVSTLVASLGANDGVAVDSQGNIYVANYGSYNTSTNAGTGAEVVKVTPKGEIARYASGLVGPVGTTISEDGTLYLSNGSDFVTGDLLQINSDGSKSILATLRGYPSGVLIGTNNNFFVSNYWLPIIHEVTQNGDTSVFASDARLKGSVGTVYGNNGDIIVGNGDNGDILSIDTNGEVSKIAKAPSGVGYITFFEDYVYATSGGTSFIYRISLSGVVEEFAGNGTQATSDGEFDKASFDRPNGIGVDKINRLLYISQFGGSLRVIPLE